MKKTAISAVLAHQWAITEDALDTICAVAERESEYHDNLEALQAKLGRPLGNTMTATVRDGVAILPVEGPMFRRANLMTEFSGATSYDVLARDFAQAEADPSVLAHLLYADSPGGEVNGASEFAQMVANATKPVWAFVSGTNASAAYWITSAADKIIAADTSIHGSIGVQAGMTIKDPKPGEKAYRFVSSNAPNKNASPETEVGALQQQALVDGLEAVMIGSIASNRGTTVENVVESFGKGAVFVASEALKRGMIDGIGTFEGTLQQLKTELNAMDYSQLTVASLTEHRKDLVEAISASAVAGVEKVDVAAVRAEGAAAERARIAGIEALALPGTETLVATLKADAAITVEAAAVQILQAVRTGAVKPTAANPSAAHLAGLEQTEAGLNAPQAGNGSGDGTTDIDAAAKAAVEAARAAGINA